MSESLGELMGAVWKAWDAVVAPAQKARAYTAIRDLRDAHGPAVAAALKQLAQLPTRRPPENLAEHVEAVIATNTARAAKREAERREREQSEAENARRNAEMESEMCSVVGAQRVIRAYKLVGTTRHGSPQEYAAAIAKRYGHPLAKMLEAANAKTEPNRPPREEPLPSIDAPPDKLAEIQQELDAFEPSEPTPAFDKVVAKVPRSASVASGKNSLFDEGHSDPEAS